MSRQTDRQLKGEYKKSLSQQSMFSVWFITRHPAAKKSQNLLSLRPTDGQTDRQTDRPSYRDAFLTNAYKYVHLPI